jgi:RpiR family transcriptional regulator, carbohydrate utilization regulator
VIRLETSGDGSADGGGADGTMDRAPRPSSPGSPAGTERAAPSAASLFHVIAQRFDSLRRSERKVARVILADPPRAVGLSLSELARRADVSTPTVMRLSAALGFAGYQDFRMALAQSVALGIPVTQSAIARDDDLPTIVRKIFDFAITSLDHARRLIDNDQVQAAVDLLVAAGQIVFVGTGASSIVALDGAAKSALFGVPCWAPVERHQQIIATSMAASSTVVVAISNTGRSVATLEAVRLARDSGAATVAIVGAPSPLRDAVDVAIEIESLENTDIFTPTTSRLTQLTVIDALATAVALRRSTPAHERQFRQMMSRLVATRLPEATAVRVPPSAREEGS